MQLRKVLFWLHLTAGCAAGVIILVMSFTGVLLTYERQMAPWLNRPPALANTPSPRLPVSALAAAVQQQRPDLAGGAMLTLRSDPQSAAEVRVGREEVVYVDPYSGQILPKTASNSRTIFQKITTWHRWLGLEGPGRATARAITGACNFCFLFIVVSGAYLWLPRRLSWQAVRAMVMFRVGSPARRAISTGHNVFGFWALIPLFFVVLTALPMSYRWANDLLYTMTGTQPPPAPARGGGPEGAGRRQRHEGRAPIDVDKLWNRAESQMSG